MVDAVDAAPVVVTPAIRDVGPADPAALNIDTAGMAPRIAALYERPGIEYYNRNAVEDPLSPKFLDSKERGAYILRPDNEAIEGGSIDPIFYSAHGRDGTVFHIFDGRAFFSPNPEGPRSVEDDAQGRRGVLMRADYIPLTTAEAHLLELALQEMPSAERVHPDLEKYHAFARERTLLITEAERDLDDMYPERLSSPHPKERYKTRDEVSWGVVANGHSPDDQSQPAA